MEKGTNKKGRKQRLLPFQDTDSIPCFFSFSIPSSVFLLPYTIPVTFVSALGKPLSSFCLKTSSAIVM